MSKTIYKPRGDRVLIERVDVGETPSGIAVPEASVEGFYHIVRAVGPKVENLEEGDKVLLVGTLNVHYAFIPNSKKLLVTREDCCWLTFQDEEE